MPPASPLDYVELRTRSAFSFLEACSNPEDLVQAAAALGHSSLALADRDGVSGLPRFQPWSGPRSPSKRWTFHGTFGTAAIAATPAQVATPGEGLR